MTEEFKKITETAYGWRVTLGSSVFPVPQIMVLGDDTVLLVFFGDTVEEDPVPKTFNIKKLLKEDDGFFTPTGVRLVPMETMADIPPSLVQEFSGDKWSREKVSEVYGV